MQELPTDTSWKCIRDHGYRLRPFPMMRWMGGLEETAGDTALRDWMLPEYDDSAWSAARVVQPVRDEYGQLTPGSWPGVRFRCSMSRNNAS